MALTKDQLLALIEEKLRRDHTANDSFTNAVADVFEAIVEATVS